MIFILLFFSGNSLSSFLFGKFDSLYLLISILIIYKSKIIKKNIFYYTYIKVALFLIVLFLFQLYELGFVSWLGVLNFLLKIFIGGLLISYLGERFYIYLFEVLYYLCFISLVFFFLINILGVSLPNIAIGEELNSYIIYSTNLRHFSRNTGMFGEPGFFGCIITLCLALNFNNLQFYFKNYPLKVIIIVLALITCQSTGSYISFFFIVIFYAISFKKRSALFIFLPALIVLIFIYSKTDFLSEKVETQYSAASEQKIGELSNTRFGSLVFDWHYIQKHPFIGNGIHEKTRYADHQYLFFGSEGKSVIGSGNGFSNYLASMGVFFIFGYFFLLYKSFNINGKFYAFIIVVIVFLNLQVEQWFNFPIYLGLPFFGLFKKYDKKLSFKTKRSQAV